MFVVALGFAFFGLAFFTEVTAARFLAVQGVESEDFGEFEEVSHSAGAFEVLVEGTFGTEHVDVFPEFGTEGRNLLEGGLEAGFVTGHAHVFPHDVTEFTMDIVNSAVTLDGEELVDAFFGLLLAVFERGIGFGNLLELGAREVAADGERNDEVTVGETLHQSRSAEAICIVVGEVGFTENEAARNRGHQIVVHPEAAHGIVDGREDAHRNLVRVFVGNLFLGVPAHHTCAVGLYFRGSRLRYARSQPPKTETTVSAPKGHL